MTNGLAKGLADLGADALVVWAGSSREPDLAPFVGAVHLGESFLIAPAQAPPRLLYLSPMEREEAAASGLALLDPEEISLCELQTKLPSREAWTCEALDRALRTSGLEPGRVALAGRGPVGLATEVGRRLEARGWSLLAGNELALELRKTKSERQVDEARRSAAGACAAMRQVAAVLAAAEEREGQLWFAGEPLRVGRLRREVAVELARFELEQPHGNLIAPAGEGAVPHNQGNPDRILAVGESLIVDLFPKGQVFADLTRTFCRGAAPESLVRAHHAVLAALEDARARLAPEAIAEGLRGFSLQQAACSVLRSHGYETPLSHPGTTRGYVHNLGHGVGYELHELPSFRRGAGAGGKLEVGDVLTLEPGLYDPVEGWAVRLEDLLYLSLDGPECLTPLPYDLEPRAWVP